MFIHCSVPLQVYSPRRDLGRGAGCACQYVASGEFARSELGL